MLGDNAFDVFVRGGDTPRGGAVSKSAERLLDQAEAELIDLFGDDLSAPELGKTRELCERLYPELLAA